MVIFLISAIVLLLLKIFWCARTVKSTGQARMRARPPYVKPIKMFKCSRRSNREEEVSGAERFALFRPWAQVLSALMNFSRFFDTPYAMFAWSRDTYCGDDASTLP
jgi:hypothetical protein